MKLERIESEITRLRAKLTDVQSRLRELERQKTEMENVEIIEVVRGLKMSPLEAAAMLRKMQADGRAAEEAKNESNAEPKEDVADAE